MDRCVFCDIMTGARPAHFAYEDDRVVAFMSLEQPNPYKVLVVPRAHVETVCDLSEKQAAAIFQAMVKVARAVRAASQCEGLNLVQSNRRAGQQDVYHFHLHILPRFIGDSVVLDWDNRPAQTTTLSRFARTIREHLR